MADSTFDLTGKTALVTGGNGDIGLGMAVIVVSRHPSKKRRRSIYLPQE